MWEKRHELHTAGLKNEMKTFFTESVAPLMFIISGPRSGTKVHPSWIFIMWSEYISIKNLISPSLLVLPWLIYSYSSFWLWRWSALTSCIWPKVQKMFSPLTRVQPQFSLTPTKTSVFHQTETVGRFTHVFLVQIKLKSTSLIRGLQQMDILYVSLSLASSILHSCHMSAFSYLHQSGLKHHKT